jgi:hypothetical protein
MIDMNKNALSALTAKPLTNAAAKNLAAQSVAANEFPEVLNFLYDVQLSAATSATDKANADKIISEISRIIYS